MYQALACSCWFPVHLRISTDRVYDTANLKRRCLASLTIVKVVPHLAPKQYVQSHFSCMIEPLQSSPPITPCLWWCLA